MKTFVHIDYRVKDLIDLCNPDIIKDLEKIETDIANVFIQNDSLIRHSSNKDSQIFNMWLICVVLSRLVSSAYDHNEILQMIADALTTINKTNYDDEYEIKIRQENSEESWIIQGKNLN